MYQDKIGKDDIQYYPLQPILSTTATQEDLQHQQVRLFNIQRIC